MVARVDWKPRMEQVRPLYAQGLTLSQIAEKTGMTKAMVGSITEIIRVEAYLQDYPGTDEATLAQDLGLSRRAIREALRRKDNYVHVQRHVHVDKVTDERLRPSKDKWACGAPDLDERDRREMAQIREDILNARIAGIPCVYHTK